MLHYSNHMHVDCLLKSATEQLHSHSIGCPQSRVKLRYDASVVLYYLLVGLRMIRKLRYLFNAD